MSPFMRLVRYVTYWVCNGPSSWNFSRYAAIMGLMSPPVLPACASKAKIFASIGSPGARRVNRNTAVTPTKIVSKKRANLRTIYAGFMFSSFVVAVCGADADFPLDA